VIDGITILVLSMESYSRIGVDITIYGYFVELFDELVDYLNVASVGKSTVEFVVTMVENDGALAFEG
jgi:hypothetical protein